MKYERTRLIQMLFHLAIQDGFIWPNGVTECMGYGKMSHDPIIFRKDGKKLMEPKFALTQA